MSTHRIYDMTFKSIYNAYVNKVTRKDRSTEELDEILRWMGSYTEEDFQNVLNNEEMTMREFFENNDHLIPQAERKGFFSTFALQSKIFIVYLLGDAAY